MPPIIPEVHALQQQWIRHEWKSPSQDFPAGIQTVGIELEGIWCTEDDGNVTPSTGCYDCREGCEEEEDDGYVCSDCRYRQTYSNLGLKSDPSVNHDGFRAPPNEITIAGEHASEVCPDWNELQHVLNAYYPVEVNRTCGMHVHVYCEDSSLLSFTDSARFYHLIRDSLTPLTGSAMHLHSQTADWLANRLDTGRSAESLTAFAMPNYLTYSPDRSAKMHKDHGWADRLRSNAYERYCWVNFDSYGSHHTVEFRVLPMAKGGKKEAMFMIQNLLATVSAYWTDQAYWDKAKSSVSLAESVTVLPEDLLLGKSAAQHLESTTHHKLGATGDAEEVEYMIRKHEMEETRNVEDRR